MNRNVRYQVAFIRNGQGRVITDVRSAFWISVEFAACTH